MELGRKSRRLILAVRPTRYQLTFSQDVPKQVQLSVHQGYVLSSVRPKAQYVVGPLKLLPLQGISSRMSEFQVLATMPSLNHYLE